MTDNAKTPPTPDSVEALLPWFATNRVPEAESKRVRDALTRDPELARRLQLVEAERDEVIALNETLGAPSNRARERLFERIGAEGTRRRAHREGSGRLAWLSDLLSGLSPRALALSTALLGGVAILQAGVVATLMLSEGGARFTTASGPISAADGSYVLIAFAPAATAAQIEAFLTTHRLTIVEGPRPGGLFRVRIGGRRLAPAELDQAVVAMRGEPGIVRLVAPSL